jgi:hypothetical protein
MILDIWMAIIVCALGALWILAAFCWILFPHQRRNIGGSPDATTDDSGPDSGGGV